MSDSGLLSPSFTRFDAKAKRTARPPGDPGGDDEQVAIGDAYATVSGQRVAGSIEFIPRDADPFIVPYAYLPLLWPRRPGILLIEYPTLFTVRLACEPLDPLTRLIRDQRITWIRECSRAEAAALPVAVTRIDILRVYPSREAASIPTAAGHDGKAVERCNSAPALQRASDYGCADYGCADSPAMPAAAPPLAVRRTALPARRYTTRGQLRVGREDGKAGKPIS